MSTAMAVRNRLQSTIGIELLVGVTGLLLVGFILSHVAGNLLIFLGPEWLNGYSEHLHELGPLLWVARLGLIAFAVTHIGGAMYLAKKNRAARAERYAVQTYMGRKSMASRLMMLSGLIILAYLFLHLSDYTFRAHDGEASIVNGENLGLFGLVWNSFTNPLRSIVYIVAVGAVGMHLSHALASVLVTLGLLSEEGTGNAEHVARVVGGAVALGFASIPIYVMVREFLLGGYA